MGDRYDSSVTCHNNNNNLHLVESSKQNSKHNFTK